jgi:hypothetical protein
MTAPRDPQPGLDLPIDASEADVLEQYTPAGTDRPISTAADPGTLSPEVPEADAAEQATPLIPDNPADVVETPTVDLSTEADLADVAEQSVPVRLDDNDDYGD